MFNCSCCYPPKSFLHTKSVWRHERKYNPNYVSPRDKSILEYMSDPKYCLQCKQLLSYDQIVVDRNRQYCSHKCSASGNTNRLGTGKTGRYKIRFCKECNVDFRPRAYNTIHCSKRCHNVVRKREKDREIIEGLVSKRPTLKRYLIETRGRLCEVCKNTDWMGESIPLELDHINGNAGNNFPFNLRLICPNCHAMTPTAKGRNKGFGRKSLGLLR